MSVTSVTVNGLPAFQLKHASGAEALVYAYAAHLASWKTADGVEQIFMSSATAYGGGKAMRGGVPVCWPQFNTRGPYGKHGFVRNTMWTQIRTSDDPYPSVVLGLSGDAANEAFPFAYNLTYAVSLDSPDSITTALTVMNPGEKPLEFTTALHTYFRLPAPGCSVRGLQGLTFEDSTKGGALAVQEEADLPIEGEIDRVYPATPSEAYLLSGQRAIKVIKMGFPDAVVWNIGAARAPELKDLGTDEWKEYVCFEAGAIAKPVKVAPNMSWTGGQTFTSLPASDVPKPQPPTKAAAAD